MRLLYQAFASVLRKMKCHEAWDFSAVITYMLHAMP